MKMITKGVMLATLAAVGLSLGACKKADEVTENKAESVKEMGEASAAGLEATAAAEESAGATEAASATKSEAGAVKSAAAKKADTMEDKAKATPTATSSAKP
ncbi:MAG: hypothetical protein JF593_02180 [Novosphingobium sp.]|nr:hypothetical protein [Novosphingobium sp.]